MPDKQLIQIVKESGLEVTKAQYILDNFSDYFALASDWEKKAKAIVVTSEDQKAEMKMAREGRLFLREKRIALEKSRKELKEQSLREGKAIDGIANVLKALIIPIEEYLDNQEKFVERKEAERVELARIEAEKKAEEERIAREKAEREEQERMRLENEKLKEEVEKRERKLLEEQKKLKEAEAEKQRIIDEQKRKEAETEAKRQREIAEAEAEKQRIAKEKEELEAGKKYQEFLTNNGYTEKTKDDFHIVREEEKVTLYKKVAEIKI